MNSATFATRVPRWIRSTAGLLSVIFIMHGAAPTASADYLPTTLLQDASMRDADLVTIEQALEMKVVQHRLQEIAHVAPMETDTVLA
ncbi:MAG: hypothetical protein PF795_14460 [Kiritimatiellae bacterium]|jgi:hypothetical protein|nr:hypothetical protein [Kiritimatiellia bacterium]